MYNSFLSPLVQHLWRAEDENIRKILCQTLMTGLMMPFTIASSFFGMKSNVISDVIGEMEGTIVGAVGSTKGIRNKVSGGEADENEQADGMGEVQRKLSKGKLKRMRRETQLLRIRSKLAEEPSSRRQNGDSSVVQFRTHDAEGSKTSWSDVEL